MKHTLTAVLAAFLILAALAVTGCGAPAAEPDIPENETLADDSGLTVTAEGSVITVTAPADETTGFAWSFRIRDESLLSCTYNSLDDISSDRSVQTYRFEALAPGRTAVELTLAQAWTGGEIDTIRVLTCEIGPDLRVTPSFS